MNKKLNERLDKIINDFERLCDYLENDSFAEGYANGYDDGYQDGLADKDKESKNDTDNS